MEYTTPSSNRPQASSYGGYVSRNPAPGGAPPTGSPPSSSPAAAGAGRREPASSYAGSSGYSLYTRSAGIDRRFDATHERAGRPESVRYGQPAAHHRTGSPERRDGFRCSTPPGGTAGADAHFRASPARRRSPPKPIRRDSRSISPTTAAAGFRAERHLDIPAASRYRHAQGTDPAAPPPGGITADPPPPPPLPGPGFAVAEGAPVDATPRQLYAAADEQPPYPPSAQAPTAQAQTDTALQQIDLTEWKQRLGQLSKEDLRALIIDQYDQARSGSIDFCDFLALWFRGHIFQIRRSRYEEEDVDRIHEPLEILGKHLYRVREIFNEYEETYLGGVRYGLIAAVLKDLQYDAQQDISSVYGLSTEDMVSLMEELAAHQARCGAGGEPRFDFAYVLQLIFKYLTDTDEIALFYDGACKVFQALRTKEYGEQPIYQNSTMSTKLLVNVLGAVTKRDAPPPMP